MLKVTIDLKKTPKSGFIADIQSEDEVTFDLEKFPQPVLDCFIADTLRAAKSTMKTLKTGKSTRSGSRKRTLTIAACSDNTATKSVEYAPEIEQKTLFL